MTASANLGGAEQIADRSVTDVVELINGYQAPFRDAQPADGDDAIYKSFVIVFTDLPTGRAKAFFDAVLEDLAVPSYVHDGFVMGGFYDGNEGTAIYNAGFRPSPRPCRFCW